MAQEQFYWPSAGSGARSAKSVGTRVSKLTVQELVARVSSLDVASRQGILLAASFTFLGGQLNRLIRIVTPYDPHSMFAEMNIHFEGLNRAAAELRMTHDQQTIELTNAVAMAAAQVIDAHHARPASRRSLLQFLKQLITGRTMGNDQAVKQARLKLSEATRDLVHYAREQLGHPQVDIWAVPE